MGLPQSGMLTIQPQNYRSDADWNNRRCSEYSDCKSQFAYADAEISRYTPSIEITRQQNEISRLVETPDVDFESAKEEICKLAELKYDCCTYSNKPQKTTQLREVLASHEQLNTLDIGLLQSCISRILVSHFCTVEIEFINGVVIKNIIERKMQNDHSAQCQGNSCKAANYGKQG